MKRTGKPAPCRSQYNWQSPIEMRGMKRLGSGLDGKVPVVNILLGASQTSPATDSHARHDIYRRRSLRRWRAAWSNAEPHHARSVSGRAAEPKNSVGRSGWNVCLRARDLAGGQ